MSSNFCSLFISTIKLSRLLLSIIHPVAIRTKQPAASQENDVKLLQYFFDQANQENDVKLLQYFFDQAPRRLFKISVEKRTAQNGPPILRKTLYSG